MHRKKLLALAGALIVSLAVPATAHAVIPICEVPLVASGAAITADCPDWPPAPPPPPSSPAPAHLLDMYAGTVSGHDGSKAHLAIRFSGDNDLLFADVNIASGLQLDCHGDQDLGMAGFWMSGSRNGSVVTLNRRLTTSFSGKTVDLTISSRATLSSNGRTLSGTVSVHVGLPWYTSDCDANLTFRARSMTAQPAPPLARVPDVRLLDVGTAVARIRTAGLVAGIARQQVDPLCRDIGRVVGSSPTQGTRVRPGSTVDYTVAVRPTGNQQCF